MQAQEQTGKRTKSLLVLTPRMVEILKAVHFYRFMTALDMASLLGKECILIKIRSDMSD